MLRTCPIKNKISLAIDFYARADRNRVLRLESPPNSNEKFEVPVHTGPLCTCTSSETKTRDKKARTNYETCDCKTFAFLCQKQDMLESNNVVDLVINRLDTVVVSHFLKPPPALSVGGTSDRHVGSGHHMNAFNT